MKKKIITIAHTKGGVGKTTIAWNLAVYYSLENVKVRLVDADNNNVTTVLNGIRAKQDKPNIKTLDIVAAKTPADILTATGSDAQIVIIDTAGFDTNLSRAAIEKSDMLICPINDGINEVIGYRKFTAALKATGMPKVHLLINNVHSRQKDFTEFFDISKGYSGAVWMRSIIRNLAAFKRSSYYGKGVWDFTNSHYKKAQENIEALAKEILEVVK